MEQFVKISCECCGVEAESTENAGAYNVGNVVEETGFTYGTCTYTQRSVWLCPSCGLKAAALAESLLAIVKSPYYYWQTLHPKYVVDEYCDRMDALQKG